MSERSELVIVTSEFPPDPGGIGVYIRNLTAELDARGWECWVAVWGRHPHVDRDSRVIRIPFLPAPPIADFQFASRLRRSIKALGLHNPLINVHTPYPQAGVRCDVATVHNVIRKHLREGTYQGWKALQYGLGARILTHNEGKLLRAKSLLAISASVVQELREEYALAREIQVVGNGVDCNKFAPGEKADRPVALFLGRLDLNKGVREFIDAARLVHIQMPDVEFRVVGDGPLRAHVEQAALEGLLGGSLHIMGYIPPSHRLVEQYQDAWIYVFPSKLEGMAATLLESMACGTPPVAMNTPSNREVLTPAEGFLVDTHEASSLAATMIRALRDRETLSRLGREARARALNQFSWNIVASRYDAALRQVVPAAWRASL